MKLSKTFNSLLMNQGKWIINNRNVRVRKRSRWIKLRTHCSLMYIFYWGLMKLSLITSLKLSLLLPSRNNEVRIIRKGQGQKRLHPLIDITKMHFGVWWKYLEHIWLNNSFVWKGVPGFNFLVYTIIKKISKFLIINFYVKQSK